MDDNMSKSMNIFLWVLQVLFGFYYVVGGLYMMQNYKMLASAWAMTLPAVFWMILSILEIIFALGLVLPGIFWTHRPAAISAIGLAVISLSGSVLYSAYAGVGFLWALVPAIFLAFIAYGRW